MSAQLTPPQRVPVATAALALGAQIGPFTVLQVLHEGPHGYVYLARDHAQGLTRVLKELMPRKHAVRHPEGDVMPLDAGDSIAVAQARIAFAAEANVLTAIEQPGLVRVLGLLSGHHTLYRVMPLYDGVTLERQCLGRSAAPTVKWVAGIVDDLLAALEALHAQGHAHGRVRPDQVLVSETQRATLLGFGSVARALDEDAAASPWHEPEGEGTDKHVPSRQASDLHALAATAWFAATGGVPPTAEQRGHGPWHAHGQLAALVDSPDDAPQLRLGLVEAIESGLALRGQQRPQTVAEFRHLLRGEPFDVSLPTEGVAGPEVTAMLTAATGVESDRIEPSWLDAPREVARVPSGAALPDSAADAGAGRVPSWAEGAAANVPPRPRRTAAQVMALAVLVLAGAGVALTGWYSSPPEPGVSMASAQRNRELPESALPLPVPAAPAVVGDAASEPPSAQPVALAAPAVTNTPPAQAAEVAAAPAVVAAAPAPRVLAVRTPAAICGNRTQFSLVYCMEQQCAKPALRYHWQCIEMRRNG